MPTTEAVAGFGVTLTRNGNLIAEINNIGDFERKQNFIEVTHHSSPDGYREYIVDKLKDGGSLPVAGNFLAGDTNGQVAMQNDLDNGTRSPYVLTFPDGTTCTFNAYVESFKIKSPMDKQMEFESSLKITGKPVLGYSAAANLTDLVVTTGILVPAFADATYTYVVNIATDQTTVTVTPTCATADAIKVDGNVVASGVPSSAIALGAAGSVTECKVEVIESGKASKKYTLYLTRAAVA